MPQDVPYSVRFDDMDAFDRLLVIDNNNDGSTWTLEYFYGVAQYHYDMDNNGDDYLVSPPLNLEAGKSYDPCCRKQ